MTTTTRIKEKQIQFINYIIDNDLKGKYSDFSLSVDKKLEDVKISWYNRYFYGFNITRKGWTYNFHCDGSYWTDFDYFNEINEVAVRHFIIQKQKEINKFIDFYFSEEKNKIGFIAYWINGGVMLNDEILFEGTWEEFWEFLKF